MKRLFSIFMALAIIIASAVVEFLLTAVTVQAATSVTLDNAVAWIKARGNESWWEDVDGVYGCQCVDLIYAYYRYLGYPIPGHNACDFANSSLGFWKADSGWYMDDTPSPGAIVAWGANVYAGAGYGNTSAYGHVGLVYSVSGSTIYTVETNGKSPFNGDKGTANALFRTRANPQNAKYIHPAFGNTHTHSYQFKYFLAEHPHRDYYECSCGAGYTDSSSSRFYAAKGCSQCCATITSGTYYFVNNGTGKALNLENNVNANKTNVHMYDLSIGYPSQQMVVSMRSSTDKSYKIRPTSSSRLIQSFGDAGVTTSGMNVNIYDDVNDNTQWWYFQAVSGGYVIRNAANTSCVLTASNDNAIVSTYTGSNNQIWTLRPMEQKYTISYNANGGSGQMANTEMTVGIAANLRANAFSRIGYTFLGWSTSPSATTATYTDKQSVKDLANSGTVTLYAVWRKADPTAVTGFTGTATSNYIKLTWNKNTTADSYKIKQLVNGTWKELTKTANNSTTTYTVSGLKANTEYRFIIYAFNGTQFSSATNLTIKTQTAAPTAVTGFTGTATSNSIKLTWNKNTTADSYKIKQLVNGTWKELTKTASNAVTSYTVSGLKANTEYQFIIYSFKGTQYSAATKITVKTTTANPSAVTGFKGTATSNSVKLTWNKNTTADSYKIKQLVNGTWKELVKTLNNSTTAYTVNGLKANTEYQFIIYSFKGTQFSSATNLTIKTQTAAPTAVTGFKGTATSNSVKLTWNKNTTADSYKIKQLVNGTWKELVKTLNNSTTAYTVNGLKANTEYRFIIYAFNGTQFSSATNLTIKTRSTAPTAVTGFKGAVSQNAVKLTWNKNSTADSYKIKQMINGSWKELTKTSSNAVTSYTITGLKPNSEYRFIIYAFNGTQFSTATELTIQTAG